MPAPPDYLVGRSEVEAAIHKQLDACQRISVYGMGGIGKTALIASIAHKRKQAGEKILWLTMGKRGIDELCNEMGRIFKDKEISRLEDEEKRRRTRSLIENHSIQLIVLDDVWSGVEARKFERNILSAGCGLIVSGRERTGVGHPYDIAALNMDDSADLFCHHADLENTPDITNICSLLAGNPLALQIAGRMAQINELSPKDLLSRLLTAGNRVKALALSKEIDENMWASLLMSFEVLNEREQNIFQSFGALWAKTGTLELLVTACGFEETQTFEALSGLVTRSLLRKEVGDKGVALYRIHDLSQDFAMALLHKNDDFDTGRNKVFNACVKYVNDHAKHDAESHQLLDAERENILEAVVWASEKQHWSAVNDLALALWGKSDYMHRAGYSREAVNLLSLGVKAARHIQNRSDEGEQLSSLADALKDLGQSQQAMEYYHEALTVAREVANRNGEARYLSDLGLTCAVLGKTEEAINYYKQALHIAREINDQRREATNLGNMGWAYADLGRGNDAISCLNQALEIERKIGDRHGEEIDLGSLGDIHLQLGRTNEALKCFEQGLQIAREISARRGEGRHLGQVGQVYLILGQTDQAIAYFRQALGISQEIGARRSEAIGAGNLGNAYLQLGEVEEALKYLKHALIISQETDNQREESIILGYLGNVYLQKGQTELAITAYQQALKITRAIGNKREEGITLGYLGGAYLQIGLVSHAVDCIQLALNIDLEIGNRKEEGIVLGHRGNASLQLQHTHAALDVLQQALAINREVGNPHEEALSLGYLGNAYCQLGQLENALECFDKGLSLIRRSKYKLYEGFITGYKGLAFICLQQLERARELFSEALEIYRIINYQNGIGTQLHNLGMLELMLAQSTTEGNEKTVRIQKSIKFLEEAYMIRDKIKDVRGVYETNPKLREAQLMLHNLTGLQPGQDGES